MDLRTMAERDIVVQMRQSEADIILRSLQATQNILELASEFLPSTPPIIEDRLQQLSKLRGLMHRIKQSPDSTEFVPRELGGSVLVRYETGRILAWGHNMQHICGWDETEMLGTVGWGALGLVELRVVSYLEQLRAELIIQREVSIPTKWGKAAHVFARVQYVEDADPEGNMDHFVLAHIWPI